MSATKTTRDTLLQAMAGHVLEHGLNTASLRPLAKAAGTSDRMLIYHFGNKDALITELLGFLSDNLATMLDSALPPGRADSNLACIEEIVALLRSAPASQFSRLWLDILSAAGQGHDSHKATGHAIIEGYLTWLEGRIPETEPDKSVMARMMLTVIEGTVVMDAVGQHAVADQAIKRLFGNR